MKTFEVVVKVKLLTGKFSKATYRIMEETPDKAKAFIFNDFSRQRYSKEEFEIESVKEIEEEA